MMNENEVLQLPPALRIAANSGRDRKQNKQDKRLILKSDAKAMRLRLAQMDIEGDRVSAGNGIHIDSTKINSTTNPGINEGKYSNEILNKKIKKVARVSKKGPRIFFRESRHI